MNNHTFSDTLRWLAVVMLMLVVVPSFGQGTLVTRPQRKTETKPAEPAKPSEPKQKQDHKKKTGMTKPQKPARPVSSHPAIVHSQQWAVDRILANMVRIEGGQLMIGVANATTEGASQDNVPAHEVSLSPYYLGKYEVTEEEWQLIVGNNPSDKSNGIMVSNTCPVDNVSWDECQQFVEKLAQLTGKPFRLPSEAEWEFAARGGVASDFLFAGMADIERCGWYVGNSSRVKHPVGQKEPNQLGLYDMTGNVREWCQDYYGPDYYAHSPSLNPQGPNEGSRRIIRGGSFNNQDEACVVTYRAYSSPDNKNKFTGLRLAYTEE